MLQSMRSAAKYVWILLIVFFVGGFLLVETSGLLGRAPVTSGTAVASVNGDEIPYMAWQNAIESLRRQEEARLGRAITLDERQRLENQAYEELVNEVLLRQEYERRGIGVTADEIRSAALNSPPEGLLQSPELQTEGRFDMDKYRRFLSSPAAKQQGLLVSLENYYRAELPKQKLFEQVTSGVYVSDAQLWRLWQDQGDSAVASYVAFRPAPGDTSGAVSDAELRAFYDRNKAGFDRPGRAVVSLVQMPRTITAADTAATRDRVLELTREIEGGARFADVAQRESVDSASAAQGGSLGRTTADVFVKEFGDAARALRPGQLSAPVLTQFGYHLITLDERKGDTLALRHILLPIRQSDSAASRLDRRADSLAAMAATSDEPAKFDSAAKKLMLPVTQVVAFEGEPLVAGGRYVPDVSAWAFGGAKPGETSDLVAADDGYYLARLDSLVRGGPQPFAAVRDDIKRRLAAEKAVEKLVPQAQQLVQAARAGSLEQAATAAGLTVTTTEPFTRASFVPGIGQANEAIGAAFALPLNTVGAPVSTRDAVIVMRVDRRVEADSAAWTQVKAQQRDQVTQAVRQQRAAQFVRNLRESAKVKDKRAQIRASARAQTPL
ncbi:MAG TPA: peptidyl-prolyl cis-trans isomerase [Gemmatimonadaceae bacterium]|nr:peptidyl-prolyl cis-trans isomerase [Gemmatimonadaceae bacterium]